uniref:Delta-like protein n=1 Tax=Phallusia mammillata TaxID=59560 RepID=A0A6F9DDU3_9ASCI|nr:Gla2 gamma-carboxyglutamic acid protein 2 [Phallusia mammillata]
MYSALIAAHPYSKNDMRNHLHSAVWCTVLLLHLAISPTYSWLLSQLSTTSHGSLKVSFRAEFSSLEERNLAREKLAFDSEDLNVRSMDDINAICFGTKTDTEEWNIHVCARLHRTEEIDDFNFDDTQLPVPDNKISLYLLAVVQGADSKQSSDVVFSSHLPPVFPSDDVTTAVDMTSTDGVSELRVYVKLNCEDHWYGPRCTTQCRPITEHHVCDQVTGDMGCAHGWSGSLCAQSVFLPRHVASQFVKSRPKRANTWHRYEELWPGNIESECEEEKCDREEAREAFEDDILTDQYWRRYIDPDHCEPNPCMAANTVRCVDQVGDYSCQCKPGFKGKNCDLVIDICANVPCANGAKCSMNSPTSYACACPVGFRGHVCDVNIDDCIDSACGIHGDCVDGVNTYNCTCDQGFTGLRCEVEIDECEPEPCKNGGNCTDHVAYHICTCPEDYHGSNCEIRHSPCRSNPCENAGECIAQPDYTYTCNCRPEFTGSTCQHEVDSPCASEPCNNDGTCYVTMNNVTNEVVTNATSDANANADFKCMCTIGYGGPTCDVEISACEYAGDPCPLNSTCVSLQMQYVCVCPVGYTGEFCHVPGNDSEAVARLQCADNPCMNEARCISHENSTSCFCRVGYNGTNCENMINYCESSPCIHGGECIPKPGDFYCNCAEGFNGRYCENDINECATSLCHNNATCNNTIGSFECLCGPYLTGRLCEHEFDPCGSTPCQHGGTCYHGNDGYECRCVPGYGGWDCQDIIDPCDPMISPCLNGGVCSPLVDDPTEANCSCQIGYYGRYCDKEVDHCVLLGRTKRYDPVAGKNVTIRVPRSDCGVHGDCISDKFGFQCDCHMGYEGERCDTAFTPPVVNCSTELCKCPEKLLKTLKAEHNVTSVPCQFKHYDEGLCAPPQCLTPPCGSSNSSTHLCSWKSPCLSLYKKRKAKKDFKSQTEIDCPVLELVFNRSRLGQVMTTEILCHTVRQLSVVSRFRGSVTVHCDVLHENEANVTMATAMDSVTSEVNAFVLASDLFQRLEEEIGPNNGMKARSSQKRDPFFSYALVEARFGDHMGHVQQHIDKLVQKQTGPHLINHRKTKPAYYIGIPVAMCLLILFLVVLFFLVRRRQRKTLQLTFVRDPDVDCDVNGGFDTASVDGIVVSPTKAVWSKISWKKNKKKRQASDSFDNPLFVDTQHGNLRSRPSVTSNAYVTAKSPMLTKSNDDATQKSVEKSTVAYSVHNSPAHSSNSDFENAYSSGDTLQYGIVNLAPLNTSPSKSSRSSVKVDPYSTMEDSPYSLAVEPGTKQSTTSRLEAKDLYSFAKDSDEIRPSGKSPSHAYAEITTSTGAFTSPVGSTGNSPHSSPSRTSSNGGSPSRASTVSALSSGKAGVDTSNTRCHPQVAQNDDGSYQSPSSIMAPNNPFHPDKQTELPEVYNVPRKANPVD